MATLNMSPVKFKLLDQCSPRRSERKRSLFPSNSPQAKDGMGGVSPLNSSPDIYSPPLPSPSWSITPTKEDTNENHHLSPRSRIKFDNLLKKKGQLEFHSLSPEPLLTKSPHKSRKALSERNFFKVFEKLPDSPEKQDPNNLPSSSKYEVVGDNYNLNKRVMKTPKKGENTDFLKRRSPKSSSEKKLEIKPRTFYGNIAPILATNQTNCIRGVKRVFGLPLMISKARTKLFNDKNEGDSKKRSRSKSSESVHRSKKRKEMYPGVRHAIKRPKSKYEDHHVALVKYDSIRDKIKKSFDFSHTPYAVKKKRNDGWDYPAKFTKPERIEGDENKKRKFFKSTVLRQNPLSVVRNGSLLTPPPSIKKRKLLDTRCEYLEDSQSQERKDNLNGISPSDILDMIEDGLVQDVECLEEQKGVSEILLHLAEDEEEEEDSLDRTRREIVELFDEDSCTDFREKSKSSPGESVSRLADSTAILAINENARDFIPSFVQEKNTKENLDSPQRFFPIFSSATTPSPHALTDVTNKKVLKEKNHWRPLLENQMQIDAGQRQFGATQCSECGLVYQLGEPDDEIQHNLYHSNFQTLRHAGWKNENVVGYFGSDRIIMVTPTDLRSWQFKAESVLQIVDKDLGFTSDRPLSAINFKAFLYVSDKTIVGCLVAVPLTEAYKMYVSETDVDICSKETYPVKCGISRIWTHSLSRRQGIATKLVDTLRRNFMYGCILSKEDIAYSVPSPDGKRFAQKYMGKTDYYVYCNF